MPDPEKPMDEPRQLKPKRRAPVIELKAEELPPPGEPAKSETPAITEPEPAAAIVPPEPAPPPAEPAAHTEAAAAAGPAASGPPPPSEPPQTRQEPLRTPPPPEPRRSHALPLTAAALAGLVFGVVGGALAPVIFGDRDGASAARLAILDRTQQQLARDQAGLASNAELDKLRQALARLESDVGQRLAAAGDPAAGLEARLAALDGELKALAARPAPTAAPAPAAPSPPAPAVDLAPLRQQVAGLDQRIGALGGLDGRLAALDGRIKALDEQVKALDGRLQAVDGRAAASGEAAQAAVKAAEAAAAAADPKIAALGQRLEQAAARIEAGRAAPLFSAVQALSQAFHRGAPFAAELTAAEALGSAPEQLAPLRPFAERGAPTAQRLAEAFQPLAGRLAGDADQPGVWGYVARFVTIRPTEETAGSTPSAIVGSIEAALRRGDVAAAQANWSRLPEPARNASAEWGRLAGQRVAAAKSLADLQAAAAAALRK